MRVNIKGQYQKWNAKEKFRNAIFTPLMHDAPKWSANAARFYSVPDHFEIL